MDDEVTLQPHIINPSDGIPRQLPQDRILLGGRLLGYVGTQRNAPINFIVYGLPDTIKHQVQLVVAERHSQLYGSDKFREYDRKISRPPKPQKTKVNNDE